MYQECFEGFEGEWEYQCLVCVDLVELLYDLEYWDDEYFCWYYEGCEEQYEDGVFFFLVQVFECVFCGCGDDQYDEGVEDGDDE